MTGPEQGGKTPVQIVDAFQAYLDERIGEIAEDDWLLLDDFHGHCDAVRREWEHAERVSVANPDVRRGLLKRCATNLAKAERAFALLLNAWISRR